MALGEVRLEGFLCLRCLGANPIGARLNRHVVEAVTRRQPIATRVVAKWRVIAHRRFRRNRSLLRVTRDPLCSHQAFRAVPNFTVLPLFPDYAWNRYVVARGRCQSQRRGYSAICLGRRMRGLPGFPASTNPVRDWPFGRHNAVRQGQCGQQEIASAQSLARAGWRC
jgi:hypothetical protein